MSCGWRGLVAAVLAAFGVLGAAPDRIALASGPLQEGKETRSPRFLLEWGDEGNEPGEFYFPIGIAISRADEVFVTDHYNNRVQRFDADGRLLSHFAVLPNPGGIAFDHKSGKLFISHFPASRLSKDKTPDRISVYTPTGTLLREWGRSGTGDGELNWPGGMAISTEGRVYVADQTNRRVQVFTLDGEFVMKWGEYGTGLGQFGGNTSKASRVGGPQFVAIDREGNVYTTEASVGRIQKFTSDGKFLLAWGDNEDRPGSFGGEFTALKSSLRGPIGVCLDAEGHLWVSAVCGRIQEFTRDGQYLRGFGSEQGSKPGQFLAPHGLAVNGQGHLYVVDAYNHRIQKFDVSH